MFKGILQSIRAKMIASFLAVITLPLLLSIFISYRNFASELEQSYIANNTVILQQLVHRLDDYFVQLENDGLSFYSDLLFSPEYQLANTEFIQHNMKLRKLMGLYLAHKETNSVLFYTPLNQELYVINKALNSSFPAAQAIEGRDWYRHAVEAPDELIVEPQHRLTDYPAEYRIRSSVPVFSLTRQIKGYTPEVGVLTINYELTRLQRISEGGMSNPDEEIGLWTAEGQLLYSSNPETTALSLELLTRMQAEDEESGSFEYRGSAGDEAQRLVYARSSHNGHLVAKLIPVHVIVAQAEKTRLINLLIALGIVLIVIGTTAFISIRLTGPLLKLKRHMVRAGEGNFQMPIAVSQTDEIGEISREYNRMIQQIDALITDKYKLGMATRESQWKALQAQINPHFMYNTLQTLGSVALDEGIDELVRMTHALSDMLRYSLKAGDQAKLADELRNVEDYLFIQTCRFEDKLTTHIEVQDEARQWMVPKLCLQPLVENAILHGLEPSKLPGVVKLQCNVEEDKLYIRISDNGVGIAPERLAELQAALEAPDMLERGQQDRIGLINVRQRLLLMHGLAAELRLHSVEGQGTQIELRIPASQVESDRDPSQGRRGEIDGLSSDRSG
ncbi:two-component sensor histidine kinase [Paenibacillus sp. 598K]|uniref:cache domain-containing sensor histidine kinase n=1 Tax=Paenibacillus sp. 598K TaxID=1117987 RepID=UPI000FF9A19C|nr:sensor histidine kinase [Paenibacillus sp. 598K]GBF71824.1 two-component sensor histidine kinase [Paenibacillus sp. 598K]